MLAAVDGVSDAYARPGRRRSAAHFRFRLGRRAAVLARDRADMTSVVGVAQSRRRHRNQRWSDEQDFRSGGEHQLDVGRSAVPRLVRSDHLVRATVRDRLALGEQQWNRPDGRLRRLSEVDPLCQPWGLE
jgi:hypothetical protein